MKTRTLTNGFAAFVILTALNCPAQTLEQSNPGATDGGNFIDQEISNPLAPEVAQIIHETGRYPLYDYDRDGWDDLWLALLARHRGAEDLSPKIKDDPNGDPDGDGIINYLEMLNFTDPWTKEAPQVPLSAEAAKELRVSKFEAERKSDDRIMSRFQTLLERNGVLQRLRGAKAEPDADADNAEQSSTSGLPAADENFGQLMLCSTVGSPKILFAERLASWQFLLAWEGEGDKLYDIEFSDDLVHWRLGASQVPVVGGIGNWGQFSAAPKRFYRVIESGVITIPSDPDGGDGFTTFGATLAPDLDTDGSPIRIFVTANPPPGVTATVTDLLVDGGMHVRCDRTGLDNVFVGHINRWELTAGSHTVEAIVHADSETTAVLEQPPRGRLRSASLAFTLEASQDRGIGFRVTEDQIAPNDPDLPTETLIAVDIPFDPQGSGTVRIIDENGGLVREWEWGLDDYPLQFREVWDGTNQAGSQMQGGSYSVQLDYGGAGFDQGYHLIAAGQRTWEALCLTEVMGGWKQPGFAYGNYAPSWAQHYTSTGGSTLLKSWGPWDPLLTPPLIADELRGMIKKVFGLANTGKWKVRFWQSESKNSDPIPDPVEAFASGVNPFNSYDIGIFIGHGAASGGGEKTLPDGTTITRPPQSYYPLVQSRATGATHWVESGSIPKYGAAGKLKWMFLMTCNSFTDTGEHEIYDQCKENNTLPFGDGLRVLCGYTTRIELEGGMGGLLSEGLVHKVPGEEFRDGTVVNAWGHVWDKSSNKKLRHVARAVFWPECEEDTIYGVKHLNIPPLQEHASQSELQEKDFTPPTQEGQD